MSDVCKQSAGGPAPRDGCSCRSCVDARLAGRTATHECVAGMGGWCITCRRPVAGRTPLSEQALIEEGYEMALRDVLSEFRRTAKAVGPHAQPDYWTGAEHVVRSLMKEGNRG